MRLPLRLYTRRDRGRLLRFLAVLLVAPERRDVVVLGADDTPVVPTDVAELSVVVDMTVAIAAASITEATC